MGGHCGPGCAKCAERIRDQLREVSEDLGLKSRPAIESYRMEDNAGRVYRSAPLTGDQLGIAMGVVGAAEKPARNSALHDRISARLRELRDALNGLEHARTATQGEIAGLEFALKALDV